MGTLVNTITREIALHSEAEEVGVYNVLEEKLCTGVERVPRRTRAAREGSLLGRLDQDRRPRLCSEIRAGHRSLHQALGPRGGRRAQVAQGAAVPGRELEARR